MPHAASNDLKTRLAQGHTTLAHLWTVTRKDGYTLRMTDHDRAITIPDTSPEEIYYPQEGFLPTAIVSSVGAGVSNAECVVVFSDPDASPEYGLQRDELIRGLYDQAAFRSEIIDWQFPEYGTIVLMTGEFGPVEWDNKIAARISLVGLMGLTRRALGESYSPECRADLGDHRCTVDIEAIKKLGTVTAKVSDSAFTVQIPETEIARRFALGTIIWETGNNAGQVMEIFQDAVAGVNRSILLTLPMPLPVQIGDTCTLYPGCDKRLATCVQVYDNAVNFRGEPATALAEMIGGYTFPA